MKKAQGLPFSTIVIVIILIVVAVTVIFVFRNYFQKEADFVGVQLSGLEDCDCDGVSDLIDECDFDPAHQKKPTTGTCTSGTSKDDCPRVKLHSGTCPTLS